MHKRLRHRYEAGLWTTKDVPSQLCEKSIFQSDHKMVTRPDFVATNGRRSQLFEKPIFQSENDTAHKADICGSVLCLTRRASY